MAYRPLVAALAAVAATLSVTTASAADRVIRSHRGLITSVGPLTPEVHGMSGLRDVFGAPTSVRPSENACAVRFDAQRITVTLAHFGTGDACDEGAVQRATVDGRRWRTQRKLRIEDTARRMHRLYPKARFRRGRWELLHGRLFGRREPTLRATVRDNRVRRLEAFLGAAGD